MKSCLKTVAVTACALAVTACVKQLWSITYDPPDRQGVWNSFVQEGPDDSVLLAGWVITSFPANGDFWPYGKGFVTRFDKNGEWQWTRELGVEDATIGVTAMDSASDGTLYVSDPRPSGRTLTRLDSAGNVIWEQLIEDSDIQGFPLLVRVVNDNLILVGMVSTVDPSPVPGALLAFDANGERLWRLDGLGGNQNEEDEIQNRVVVIHDAEVLPDERIVSFVSFTHPATGVNAGSVYVLDAAGNKLHSKEQQALGLERLFDSAVLGNQVVVVGSTGSATRIVMLDDQLNVLRQQDFMQAETARLATADGTLCFALLDDVSWSDWSQQGKVLLGTLAENGQSWSTSRDRVVTPAASLDADQRGCAYTDSRSMDVDSSGKYVSDTFIYSSKGIEAEVSLPGLAQLIPARLPQPRVQLRGHHFVSVTSDVDETGERVIARVHKHFVRRYAATKAVSR